MPNGIVRQQSPEEREYARYLGEIEARRLCVAELQADLASFKEQLGRFNAEYHSRVGVLFVELDKIELAISEYQFRILQLRSNPQSDPETLERDVSQQYAHQRERIDEDEDETRYYQQEHRQEQKRPDLGEASARELLVLYRELAKRFHPDLAKTGEERVQREVVMKEVNAAFHERDIDQLRMIAAQREVDESSFNEKSIGEKLVWAIREISRLDALIESLALERSTLEASELHELWLKRKSGEDVIGRLEHELRLKTDAARESLRITINEYRGLVEHYYGQRG